MTKSLVNPGSKTIATRRVAFMESVGRRVCAAVVRRIVVGRLEILDGPHRISGGEASPQVSATIVVSDPQFYAALAFGGSVGVCESYMAGHWQCEDLSSLVELMILNEEALKGSDGGVARIASAARRVKYWLQRNTKTGSRKNIHAHYDLSNEFFATFLDPSMTYSCAIFDDPSWTLDRAQEEKIDRTCRKLALKPTDHLLEIGSGWGALAIHAAQRYGCRVTTTTISDEQFALAVKRVREAGLENRVSVIKSDYRDLRPPEGTRGYDKLVSIEMLEAVGAEFLDGYFEKCASLLAPDGVMVVQSIVIRDQLYDDAKGRMDFLKAYIFPGSCLPSVYAMNESVKKRTDLRVWHTEDFGPHYAMTLAMWRERFWANIETVRALGYTDSFVRMWHLYLCYCEGAFRARKVGDVQMTLTKPMARIDPIGARVIAGGVMGSAKTTTSVCG